MSKDFRKIANEHVNQLKQLAENGGDNPELIEDLDEIIEWVGGASTLGLLQADIEDVKKACGLNAAIKNFIEIGTPTVSTSGQATKDFAALKNSLTHNLRRAGLLSNDDQTTAFGTIRDDKGNNFGVVTSSVISGILLDLKNNSGEPVISNCSKLIPLDREAKRPEDEMSKSVRDGALRVYHSMMPK